jgi:hypothetical protein
MPRPGRRPRPQGLAPDPGRRRSPARRTGTHPWTRGRTPQSPAAGLPHPHNAQLPATDYTTRYDAHGRNAFSGEITESGAVKRRQPVPAVRTQAATLRKRYPRHHLAALPGRHRHPTHHPNRRHLRAEPAQPPPRPHRCRLRRPAGAHPLVGRPAAALPFPTPLTPSSDTIHRNGADEPRTSTDFLYRESRLARRRCQAAASRSGLPGA